MVDKVEQVRDQIAALCRRYGVKRLELFGSAARGDFDPNASDFDFFVEFEDTGWKGSFRRYMGLKLAMEALLGRNVDLIEPETISNPYFLQVATQHKSLVYGKVNNKITWDILQSELPTLRRELEDLLK